jgi:uncharacterized protein YecT (DUF1311 family)
MSWPATEIFLMGLREAQRAWIRTRDASPVDVRALTRVYDARIRALGGSLEASSAR